jgi:hypothetical protein
MKIGKTHYKPVNEEIVPILRADGNLYFVVQAMEDPSEFDRLCPTPNPPTIEKPGQAPQPVENASFRQALAKNATYYFDFMVIKSVRRVGHIETSEVDGEEPKQTRIYEDIEWETVNIDDITTYHNYRQDLEDFGLITAEINRITEAVMVANGLSLAGIDKAKEDFLALPVAQ